MITLRPKLWGPVLVVCFCLVCNVEAAGRTYLESSFLRKVQMVLESLQEHGLDIRAHPEKALKYVKIEASTKEIKLQMAKEHPSDAEKYYKECLSIPLFSAMSKSDAERVIFEIHDTIEKFCRDKKI